MPALPLGVQDRQPGLALRVEALRRDPGQFAGGGLPAILGVDVEQQAHGGCRSVRDATRPRPPEHRREAGADCRRTSLADAGNAQQRTVMGRRLQRLERIDMQRLVNVPGKLAPDPGQRPEQGLGRRVAAQAVQL